MTIDARDLADEYTAVWNERDPAKRRTQIERLFTADGLHFTPTRQFQGFDALEARVLEAHTQFITDRGLRLQVAGIPDGHHGVVKFYWEIVDPRTDVVQYIGFDVLQLNESDKIISDHQFSEPPVPKPAI